MNKVGQSERGAQCGAYGLYVDAIPVDSIDEIPEGFCREVQIHPDGSVEGWCPTLRLLDLIECPLARLDRKIELENPGVPRSPRRCAECKCG